VVGTLVVGEADGVLVGRSVDGLNVVGWFVGTNVGLSVGA
jgi:hypothetical protein